MSSRTEGTIVPEAEGPHSAYIGVGSNLQHPMQNVRNGIAALSTIGSVVKQSSLYRANPWGVTDQPEYINAVVLLETQLDPHALLAVLKQLETKLGRIPSERWGPRIIDFDILTYDDIALDETRGLRRLRIPHPRMHERAFVLVPLAEIDPAFNSARDALSSQERSSVRSL